MEATSPWITVVLALIAALGGAPLFTFLAERIKGNAATRKSERDELARERVELRQEREAFWDERRRLAENDRLELRTLRSAFNEVTETNGRLRGQLDSANERIDELEAVIERLRKGQPT